MQVTITYQQSLVGTDQSVFVVLLWEEIPRENKPVLSGDHKPALQAHPNKNVKG